MLDTPVKRIRVGEFVEFTERPCTELDKQRRILGVLHDLLERDKHTSVLLWHERETIQMLHDDTLLVVNAATEPVS